jgi:hypothetical protein
MGGSYVRNLLLFRVGGTAAGIRGAGVTRGPAVLLVMLAMMLLGGGCGGAVGRGALVAAAGRLAARTRSSAACLGKAHRCHERESKYHT